MQWNRLDKKQILKYNIDTKFKLGKLINDIYSFDSNINYSNYLYNSLLSILVYCSNDIYSVANNVNIHVWSGIITYMRNMLMPDLTI